MSIFATYVSSISYLGYPGKAYAGNWNAFVFSLSIPIASFYFDVATKEKPAHLAVGQISQWNIDKAMDIVRANIVDFQKMKTGEIEAPRCEEYGCDWCTSTKIITEAIDTDLFGMSASQIRGMRGEIL